MRMGIGVQTCENCNHGHGLLICTRYRCGLYVASKSGAYQVMGALNSLRLLSPTEQEMMPQDIASSRLPENDRSDPELTHLLTRPEEGIEVLASLAREEKHLRKSSDNLMQFLTDTLTPDIFKAAVDAGKKLLDAKPNFVTFTSKNGRKYLGMLMVDKVNWTSVLDKDGAMAALKAKVQSGEIEPDCWKELKKLIKQSDLPQTVGTERVTKDSLAVYLGNDESTAMRFTIVKNNQDFLIFTKQDATATLKNLISDGHLPFESYNEFKSAIDNSPLPQAATEELIALDNNLAIRMTKVPGRVLTAELALGIKKQDSSEGFTFTAMPVEKVREVFITPPPEQQSA